MSRRPRSRIILWALVALAACDNTFDPLVPGGPPFSVFGVLNPSADTQWIRINGTRSTLLATTGPSGYVATLEDLGTSQVLQLRDSAMPFVNMAGAEPIYAHNFWTAERLQPGASYRFRVRSDSAVAESIVKLPRDFQWEVWISQRLASDPTWVKQTTDLIWLGGVKQLVRLTRYTTLEYQPPVVDTAAFQAAGGDSISRTVGVAKDTVTLRNGTLITNRELEFTVSDVPWPFGQDMSTWTLKPGANATNVANSLGFLGGILTKRIPLEACDFVSLNTTDRYCKLRYDSTTATLRGNLVMWCPIPGPDLFILLRELDSAGSDPPRIRRPYHDSRGHFEVGALRPGIRHELIVRDTAKYLNILLLKDTLTFRPGEQATYTGSASWPYEGCPYPH